MGAIQNQHNYNSRTRSTIVKLGYTRFDHCNEIVTASMVKYTKELFDNTTRLLYPIIAYKYSYSILEEKNDYEFLRMNKETRVAKSAVRILPLASQA